MDPITTTILSYLIGLAAGLRTDAILKTQTEKHRI